MANENDVPINITIETDDAKKSLKSIESDIGKTVNNSEKLFEGLKFAIGAALAVFASKAIVNGIKDIVGEAAAADQAVRNLANALAITGEFSDEAVDNMTAFASAIQKTSTNTDDAVIQALTLAKTFGITNDQAQKLVGTAVDLAAATGTDLNTAVQQLGATYSGTAGRLSKVTPALKELTEAQLKNGEAIDIVSKKFKGFAESSAQTFSGSLIQTQNAFGDIFESLGKVVTQNPVVIASIKALGRAFFEISEFIDQNKETLTQLLSKGLKEVVSFVPTAIKGFAVLAAGLQAVTDVTAVLVTGLTVLGSTLYQVLIKPITDVAEIITNVLITSLSGLTQIVVQIAKVIPGAGDALKGMGIDLNDLEKTVSDFSNLGLDSLLTIDRSVSESWSDFVDDTGASIIGFTDKTQQSFNDTFDVIGAQALKIADVAQKATDGIEKVGNSAVKVTKDVKNVAKEVEDFDLTKFLKDAKVSLDVSVSGVTGALTAANGILDSAQGLIDSIPQLLGKVTKIFNSLTDLPDAILKGVQALFKAIPRFISEFIPNLLRAIPEIIAEVIEALANSIPDAIISLANALPDIITQFISKLETLVEPLIVALVEATPRIMIGLVDAFVTKGGAIKVAVALIKALSNPQLYIEIGRGIIASLVGLGSQVANQFKLGVAGLGKKFGTDFTSSISGPFNNFINGIKNAFSFSIPILQRSIINAFTGGADVILQSLGVPLNQFVENFLNAGTTILNNLAAAVQNILSIFESIFEGLYNAIKKPFEELFSETGKIRDRIVSSGNELAAAFRKPVDDLINFLRNFNFPKPGNNAVIGGTGKGTFETIIGYDIPGAKFASGALIPPGFPNDSFGPANLSSGELVLPPDISKGLIGLINEPDSSAGLAEAILLKILAAVQAPQQVSTSITIGSRELANVILDLQRNNQRLTA